MTQATKLIKDDESLVSAQYTSGYTIPIYDDGFGQVWISRNSSGINGIVRAQTWEDAYSICEDEFFPEADETVEELQREYGFDPDAWIENELFQESYGFRANGPNERDKHKHGIYQKDLNGDALDRLTTEMLTDLEIELTIEGEDYSETEQ